MRGLIRLLAFFILLLAPIGAHAQSATRLRAVTVNIWPEYDQPAVLVIYHLTLAADTELPATLMLRVPAQAGMSAVAILDQTGSLYNTPYDRVVQGEWAVLTITANSLQIQVEYYAALDKSGSTRHIVFTWAGDYALDVLNMNFLQPIGATNVSIDPAPADTSPGQDGLTNYHIQGFHLPADRTFTLTIDYDRSTDDLSIASLPVQAVTTPGPDTPGRVSMTGFLPGALLGFGVILIASGVTGFVFWRRGGRRPTGDRRHTTRREVLADELIYCQECGKRAQPGDLFCRTCGTRLRHGTED